VPFRPWTKRLATCIQVYNYRSTHTILPSRTHSKMRFLPSSASSVSDKNKAPAHNGEQPQATASQNQAQTPPSGQPTIRLSSLEDVSRTSHLLFSLSRSSNGAQQPYEQNDLALAVTRAAYRHKISRRIDRNLSFRCPHPIHYIRDHTERFNSFHNRDLLDLEDAVC
jgi:hypothetical protein